jgi:uncharacterized membrane protein
MEVWNWIFRLFCHQIAERSPVHENVVFPVCYRCAGLYGGLLLGYTFLALRGGLCWRFPGIRLALAAAALTFGLVFDGWANSFHLWNSPPLMRALTGLAAGVAIPVLLLPLAGADALSAPDTRALFVPLCVGLAFLWMLAHPVSQSHFQFLALTCTAGLACLLANLWFACRTLRRA